MAENVAKMKIDGDTFETLWMVMIQETFSTDLETVLNGYKGFALDNDWVHQQKCTVLSFSRLTRCFSFFFPPFFYLVPVAGTRHYLSIDSGHWCGVPQLWIAFQ